MYLPASDKDGKNIYLATVIDVYSRKLVGHALADHMRVSLVIEALSHARKVRGSLNGAIFHSDHGSVYTSQAFRDHCAQLGVRQSMGAVGTSADRSPSRILESVKCCVIGNSLKVQSAAARKSSGGACSCNTRRRHSWCNLLASDSFEALRSVTLTQAA